MQIMLTCNVDDYKVRIIGVCGKEGSGKNEVYEWLLKNIYLASPIHQVKAGEHLSDEEFLKRLVEDRIIAATCNDKNEIWGVDISGCLSMCIYVGMFTPEEIDILKDCDKIELLVIETETSVYDRLVDRIDGTLSNKQIIDICKNLIEEEENYNVNEDYFNNEVLYLNFLTLEEKQKLQTKCEGFKNKLLAFNEEHNCITDLDKFI